MTTTADAGARAAQLIADNLAKLNHPGDGNNQKPVTLQLPFRTAGMPPALAAQITTSAQLIAEAIIHLLRSNGIQLTDTADTECVR